jgi:hypothetical protein
MINILPVPNHCSRMVPRTEAKVRVATAAALMATAVVGLAVTSLVQSRDPATAEPAVVQPASVVAAVDVPVPLERSDVGPFAMGYLVFDWNPADGVSGFDSWPPGSRR